MNRNDAFLKLCSSLILQVIHMQAVCLFLTQLYIHCLAHRLVLPRLATKCYGHLFKRVIIMALTEVLEFYLCKQTLLW